MQLTHEFRLYLHIYLHEAPLNMRKPLADQGFRLVGDTGFEPVTSSVSRKRATTAPIALGCEVETGFEPV